MDFILLLLLLFIISASVQTLVCGVRDRAPNISLSYLLLNHRLNAIYQSIHSLFNCSVHIHTHRTQQREKKIFAPELNPPPRSIHTLYMAIEACYQRGRPIHEKYVYCMHSFIECLFAFFSALSNICLFIVEILT